nr:serine/threonine-protein kinase cbk1 [Quercus suber]
MSALSYVFTVFYLVTIKLCSFRCHISLKQKESLICPTFASLVGTMPDIDISIRATGTSSLRGTIKRRASQIFAYRPIPRQSRSRKLASTTPRSRAASKVKAGRPLQSRFPRLRKSASKVFPIMRIPSGMPNLCFRWSSSNLTMIDPPSSSRDRLSSPHHRTASPTAPALSRVSRIRGLLSSSSQDSTRILRSPQRKLSVRFQSPAAGRLDGPISEEDIDARPSSYEQESPTLRMSQKIAARVANLEQKLGLTGGTQTIVHRANMKVKRSFPELDTGMSMMVGQNVEDAISSPTTTTSSNSRRASGNLFEWSPLSQFSTPGTSFHSSASRHRRQTPEECQTKGFTAGADELLPSIQEDTGRYVTIPVQEAILEVAPSVITVESVAAAKIYLETYFEKIMFQPVSPRSLRLRKFEQRLRELDIPDEERLQARIEWNRMESNNLRQIRVLKASSIIRHSVKGVSISGFDVIRVLGKGSFGVVRLVTERTNEHYNSNDDRQSARGDNLSTRTTCLTGMDGTARRNLTAGRPLKDVFAMKVIRKSAMLRACQEGHLRAERDFLVSAEGSRWTVPLIASFQDNTNLYLVMEYMIGGDFLGLLLREDVLEEEVAQ